MNLAKRFHEHLKKRTRVSKKISILILIVFNTMSLYACDFCNCYLGLNPQYKKNLIGLRYHYKSFNGTHHDLAEFPDAGLSKKDFWEKRTTTELHGQWYPVQKLQVIYSVPFMRNKEGMSAAGKEAINGHHHGSNGSDAAVSGFGDPVVIAHYQVFNKISMDSNKFSQRLFAGGGVKLPLGKYKLGTHADPMERVHQPGSGSYDFIVSASYLGKINKAGFNVNLNHLFATTNNEYFRFGNRLNANATVYYQYDIKKSKLYPSIGAYLEKAARDLNDNNYMSNSGGSIVYGHAGLDLYFKKLLLSASFQLPVHQTLNNPQPGLNYRIITGISYAIN